MIQINIKHFIVLKAVYEILKTKRSVTKKDIQDNTKITRQTLAYLINNRHLLDDYIQTKKGL